jgi:branched-chain amino acid aminotransferase
MVSPRAKTHNYLNLILADLEVSALNPGAHAILLDENGNLSEGKGSNFFLVTNGVIKTPKERYVLPGVSRSVVRELANKLAIPIEETDIDLFDAYNADECFISSTSFCICPIRSVNGTEIPSPVPGTITQKIIDAYVEYVGFDWYAQYLSKLKA